MLKPALVRLWRDESTLQIGLDPERAVVLDGLDPRLAEVVEGLDGRRETEQVVRDAAAGGADPQQVRRLIGLLQRARVLDNGAAPAVRARRSGDWERLAREAREVSAMRGDDDGGAGVLARRAAARVAVVGQGWLAATVTEHLRGAGVGSVRGLASARAAVDPTSGAALVPSATLVVLTERAWLDPVLVGALMREGITHLVARVTEARGVVGPLVVPGVTSCLRCHHLLRSARDPAWPRLAVQLARARWPAGSSALIGVVAAHAALQALAHLDAEPAGTGTRHHLPAAFDGQLEIDGVTGAVRRRSWRTHHACGCDWDHRRDDEEWGEAAADGRAA